MSKKVDVAGFQLPGSTNKTTNKNGSTIEGLSGTLPHDNMATRNFKPLPSNVDNSITQNDNSVKNNTITNNNYMQGSGNNTQKKDLSSPKLVSKRDLQNTNNGMRVY